MALCWRRKLATKVALLGPKGPGRALAAELMECPKSQAGDWSWMMDENDGWWMRMMDDEDEDDDEDDDDDYDGSWVMDHGW